MCGFLIDSEERPRGDFFLGQFVSAWRLAHFLPRKSQFHKRSDGG
jgi:hypothetical protein